MKTLDKHIILAVLCGVALAPALAMASPPVSKEQAAEGQRKYLKEAREQMIALRDEADLVFVGRLASLDVRREAREAGAGKIPSVVDVYEAVFAPVDNIKGAYPRGQALTYEISQTRVMVGGRHRLTESLPKKNGAGDSYLVYAKEGKILRTNRYPDWQPMDARAEAALLRGAE